MGDEKMKKVRRKSGRVRKDGVYPDEVGLTEFFKGVHLNMVDRRLHGQRYVAGMEEVVNKMDRSYSSKKDKLDLWRRLDVRGVTANRFLQLQEEFINTRRKRSGRVDGLDKIKTDRITPFRTLYFKVNGDYERRNLYEDLEKIIKTKRDMKLRLRGTKELQIRKRLSGKSEWPVENPSNIKVDIVEDADKNEAVAINSQVRVAMGEEKNKIVFAHGDNSF